MTRYTRLRGLGSLAILACTGTFALVIGPAQADICPPGTSNPAYCEGSGSAGTSLVQQQQAAQSAQQNLSQVTSPIIKQAVTSVLNLSNSLASQAQKLLVQAGNVEATDPALAKLITSQAVVMAAAAAALARAAQATVLVVLKVQNAGIKGTVQNDMAKAKFYAVQAAALIKQAQGILGQRSPARDAAVRGTAATRPTPAQRRRAQALINKAKGFSTKAYNTAQDARHLAAVSITPAGPAAQIWKAVTAILNDYKKFLAQTIGLESHVKSSATRRAIDRFLAQAQGEEKKANVTFDAAVLDFKGGKAFSQMAIARVSAAVARSIAANARGVAAAAVRSRK